MGDQALNLDLISNIQTTFIKEAELKKVILELYEFRDQASKILDSITDIVNKTSNYYDSEDGKKYREKYQQFSYNYNTFLNNLQSYGDDLTKVIHKYKQVDMKSVDIFKE